MAYRTSSIRLARALTKQSQPTAHRSISAASALQPQNYSINNILCASRSSSLISNYNNNNIYCHSFSTKPEEEQPSDEAAAAQSPSEGEDTEETTNNNDAPSEEDKITKLETQIKDLKDQVLRSLAEQENVRSIAKRDVQNAKTFAITSFAKSLLDTSDNLSRALDAVPEELRHDHENQPVLANLYEGITMTETGLNKAFNKNGLKKFGEKGEKFDPNIHEALFEYPDPEGEVGNIGQVMKVGFMLNERVVRPAEVGVVKAP